MAGDESRVGGLTVINWKQWVAVNTNRWWREALGRVSLGLMNTKGAP